MTDNFTLIYVDDPEQSAWGIIGRGVGLYNRDQAGESEFQRLCFILQDQSGEIQAGILGETYWDWFYLDLLWVREDLRGRGYGKQLMQAAEVEARKRGVKHAYLDTFSFQAPGFYEKMGYQVFGELPDFPVGHQRYFMAKEL